MISESLQKLKNKENAEHRLNVFVQKVFNLSGSWSEFVLNFELHTGAELNEQIAVYTVKWLIAQTYVYIYSSSPHKEPLKKLLEMSYEAVNYLKDGYSAVRIYSEQLCNIQHLIDKTSNDWPDRKEVSDWFKKMFTALIKLNPIEVRAAFYRDRQLNRYGV